MDEEQYEDEYEDEAETKQTKNLKHEIRSHDEPEIQKMENFPASFGSYTCPTCDNKFQNKDPLNIHLLSMHAEKEPPEPDENNGGQDDDW